MPAPICFRPSAFEHQHQHLAELSNYIQATLSSPTLQSSDRFVFSLLLSKTRTVSLFFCNHQNGLRCATWHNPSIEILRLIQFHPSVGQMVRSVVRVIGIFAKIVSKECFAVKKVKNTAKNLEKRIVDKRLSSVLNLL